MNINIPQTYFSKLMRAVVEFELIDNGDRILIGVSGGKDSIFLTYALAILRERLKKDFTIAAFTVNPQFDDPFDTNAIATFCKQLNVPRWLMSILRVRLRSRTIKVHVLHAHSSGAAQSTAMQSNTK